MKFCKNCGTQLEDSSAYCYNCGTVCEQAAPQQNAVPQQQPYVEQPVVQQPVVQQQYTQQQPYAQQQYVAAPPVSGLATAAKILMIISTVITGFYLLPLAWCLPMTISYCNKLKTGQPVTTGFKVCTVLFVNTIAGILMLCDKNQ